MGEFSLINTKGGTCLVAVRRLGVTENIYTKQWQLFGTAEQIKIEQDLCKSGYLFVDMLVVKFTNN